MTGAPAVMTESVDIGILIVLPEPLASRVAQVREAVGDDPGDVPPHITLLPPTTIDSEDVTAVLEHVRHVAAATPAFEVELSGTDTFEPVTHVVYVAVGQGGEQCDALQEALRAGPLETELRFPYHPHVTLAHDVPRPGLERARRAMASTEEILLVDGFDVFLTEPGGTRWTHVARVPLGGA